jgi:hypothetical protein
VGGGVLGGRGGTGLKHAVGTFVKVVSPSTPPPTHMCTHTPPTTHHAGERREIHNDDG